MKHLLLTLLVLSLSFPAVATKGHMVGKADVIDGDTIVLHWKYGDTTIDIRGIDAPELEQKCYPNDKVMGDAWMCGLASKEFLKQLIGDDEVFCTSICSVNNVDITTEIISKGWAVVLPQNDYYNKFQEEAKAAKRGIWASEFEMPWDYRKNKRKK